MGNCDIALEWISASLDGALTEEEQTALDAHLAECAACSALYAELCALHTAAAELEELSAPAGFTDTVMAAIAAESAQDKSDNVIPFTAKRKTRAPWKRWAASAAAVAIVALGAVSIPSLSGNMELARDTAAPAEPMAPQFYMEDSAESEIYYSGNDMDAIADIGTATPETPDTPIPEAAPEESKTSAPAESSSEQEFAANAPLCDARVCCGTLTLPADLAPEGLEQYEGAINIDGTVNYTVPADYFFSVLKTLENSSRTDYQFTAGQTDAEQGIIIVTATGQ